MKHPPEIHSFKTNNQLFYLQISERLQQRIHQQKLKTLVWETS
jgi:hypothetical protein